MKKNIQHRSKRRNKKSLLLFMVFGITLVIFITTTYAWFVGIGSVKINAFNISLEAENSLEISLDGYTWDDEINITENNIKAHNQGGLAYTSNNNSWVGERGLVPISTSGDNTLGRLNFFTISSLVRNEGGYTLVADPLDNYLNEKDYYVAFDIFVKNKTGDVYNPEYNLLEDENIYLTSDSEIVSNANGVTNYGVQNSARVAFVQIGRVSLDDLESGVTPDIKCQTPLSSEDFTPLCDNEDNYYRTMIWEPNEASHATKLVSYYNYVCKNRTGITTYGNSSCTSITGGYVPTYTVKKKITSDDKVDQYDGLNSYMDNISTPSQSADYLQSTITYTDAMKDTGGDYTLMKLHPHSVTKIRVYIYLEGQDVDNYDLITNDLNIQVNFGFTRERTSSGEIVDDSYFAKLNESFVTEKSDYVAGRDLVLVYTNTNTPGFTYNGQMMYDLSDLNYKYGGVSYSHIYGMLVAGDADLDLVDESKNPAIKIDRSSASSRYDINSSGLVDQVDSNYCNDVYFAYSNKFTTENLPLTLYCDITGNKIVDTSDVARIVSNYDDVPFSIDGVTYYAKPNMTWRNWIDSDYNTNNYNLMIVSDTASPRYIGKPDASGNTNYACGVGYLSNRPSAYSCIFGSGSRIKAVFEIPYEQYNQSYGNIIANHNYETFIAYGGGPL